MLPEYSMVELDESLFEGFKNNLLSSKKSHTVVKLSEKLTITEEHISFFINTSISYKKDGMSFVVIKKGIDIDNFPEELNIVPTLQEAEDILEMEAIERDLGF